TSAVTADIRRSKSRCMTASAFTSARANRARTDKPPAIELFCSTASRLVFAERDPHLFCARCRAREVFPGDGHWLRQRRCRPGRFWHGPCAPLELPARESTQTA